MMFIWVRLLIPLAKSSIPFAHFQAFSAFRSRLLSLLIPHLASLLVGDLHNVYTFCGPLKLSRGSCIGVFLGCVRMCVGKRQSAPQEPNVGMPVVNPYPGRVREKHVEQNIT